jgi:SRSO17 transposase
MGMGEKGMDSKEIKALRPALGRFCRKFDGCIKDPRTRKHLKSYVNGQLSNLPRKSIEPMALEAGTPVRTLQEFLSIHRWDHEAAATRLREIVRKKHGNPNAIGVIDETSFKKKGNKTPGVQRQWCGSTGKVDNCVVSVHLGFVSGDFHTFLDGDLYLPEETWGRDSERRKEAGIPEEVVYRPKWKIALDLLGRTLSDGVAMKWVTADEAYGRALEFREGVEDLGLLYVVEIPSNLVGWSQPPKIDQAGTVLESGYRSRIRRLAGDAQEARPVSRLWRRGGPSWERWRIKETDKGPSVWEVRETDFYPTLGDYPGAVLRLVIAREALSGEVKYFLSNAPREIPLGEVLHVAFSRWRIERIFEDAKGEVGLDHFEVRNYRSLIRHLILSMISFYFLADRTQWLKEKKLELDALPSQTGDRMSTGPDALAA